MSKYVRCPSGCDKKDIWGSDIYTDDSPICISAAHVGLITLENGGTFEVTATSCPDEYFGSWRNGIKSKSYGWWKGAFSMTHIPEPTKKPEPTLECEDINECKLTARGRHKWSAPARKQKLSHRVPTGGQMFC